MDFFFLLPAIASSRNYLFHVSISDKHWSCLVGNFYQLLDRLVLWHLETKMLFKKMTEIVL